MRHMTMRGAVLALLLGSAPPAAGAEPEVLPPPAALDTPIAQLQLPTDLVAPSGLSAELRSLGINLYEEHTMAETRKGGVYRVGDEWQDADGKKTSPPSKQELQVQAERRGITNAATAARKPDAGPAFDESFPSFNLLSGAGFDSLEKVKGASDEDLLAIDGIGDAKLAEIRKAAG